MSTQEARAPGEDVEGLAKQLEGIATRPTPDGASFGTLLAPRALLNQAAATLRDLSRKLEDVRRTEGEALAALGAAMAALEEARRERDEWIENHRIVAGSYNMAVEENERFEEALREIRDTDWIENALNPQGPADIARRALSPQPQEPRP